MIVFYNQTATKRFGKASKCYPEKKKEGFEEFTSYEPTDFRDEYNSIDKGEIGLDQVNVSPHIHGLEVRPAFDRNPLAWFSMLVLATFLQKWNTSSS